MRRPSDTSIAAGRVAQIVEAAELAADDMRASAEERTRERIAEAERAADLRVRAAEEEALALRAEAEERALQIESAAQADARATISQARAAAREVLRDGEQLSGDLRELSDSMRVNAERLLRDIRMAHAELTARLNKAMPEEKGKPRSRGKGAAAGRTRSEPANGDLDVPEFIPKR